VHGARLANGGSLQNGGGLPSVATHRQNENDRFDYRVKCRASSQQQLCRSHPHYAVGCDNRTTTYGRNPTANQSSARQAAGRQQETRS
jgi:ribosomal protein S27E